MFAVLTTIESGPFDTGLSVNKPPLYGNTALSQFSQHSKICQNPCHDMQNYDIERCHDILHSLEARMLKDIGVLCDSGSKFKQFVICSPEFTGELHSGSRNPTSASTVLIQSPDSI